jgi:hypothetical protein
LRRKLCGMFSAQKTSQGIKVRKKWENLFVTPKNIKEINSTN